MNQITHGINGYKKHRCRCKVCSTANSNAMKRYHQRRKVNFLPAVSFEVWSEVWNEIRATDFSITEMYHLAQINACHFIAAAKKQATLQGRTFEKLKAAGEILVAERAKQSQLVNGEGSEKQTDLTPERIKSIKAFNKVFRYFRYAGFTMTTLAKRLDITPDELQSFIDSKYEDKTIAIRAARLHWIISRGDDEEEEENAE